MPFFLKTYPQWTGGNTASGALGIWREGMAVLPSLAVNLLQVIQVIESMTVFLSLVITLPLVLQIPGEEV